MRTKEKIFSDSVWKSNVGDDTYPFIMQAMDEYAKQDAIEFSKWKDKEGYELHSNGFYYNEPTEAGKQTFFNTPELYQKYLISKK